jgi:hypothetical protein
MAFHKSVLWLVASMLLVRNLTATEIYPVRIFSSTQAVAAVVAGEFDPIHPGNELACLMANGNVIELALGPSGWTASPIYVYKGNELPPWEDPRSRVTLNIGDVLSEHPGPEIVFSFYQQIVAVYYQPPNGWTNQVVADFSDFIGTSWGAEVGNCDRSHPGDEVFSIYEGVFDFSSGTVFGKTNGGWQQNLAYYAEVGMDAAIGDSNPDFPGDEIIVVTEMGPAYEITPPAGGGPGPWPNRTIWNDEPNAGWVVKIGDVDPASPGNEVVYGTRYSDRIMMSRYNGTDAHNVEVLFTGVNTNELNNMLDVAIGQVFPSSPAAEILGVDASGSAYVVQRLTNQWRGSVLWQDTNALYAVAAGDLILSPGDEVVVAGASGVVTLLLDPSPALSPSLTPERQAVLSWTGINGLTYAIETTTNLASSSSWRHVTNLIYQGAFQGGLSYTNATGDGSERFFRVRASW